jgi:hypothetical protein
MVLENYVNCWRRLGFTDADFAGGGSDRFIDSIIAWGDEKALRARVDAHFAAGADHVCIQPLDPEGTRKVDERVVEMMAPKGS